MELERLKRDKNMLNLEIRNLEEKNMVLNEQNKFLMVRDNILQEIEQYLLIRTQTIKEKYPNELNAIEELEKLSELINKSKIFYERR